MSPSLKVGDRVRTATALMASHWTQNEMACRQPGAEGTIARRMSPREWYVGCSECRNQGRYIVEHNQGQFGDYHGNELTLVTPVRRKGEPEPGDEPDGGRLGEKVEALDIATAEAIKRIHAQLHDIREHLGTNDDKTGLSGQLDALRGRVAALEQPPAPEPVDPSAALEAVPDLVRALNEQPPPVATQSPPRSVLEAYRALHRAAAGWWADIHCEDPDPEVSEVEEQIGAALRAIEQLGVAPVHDDSSLDPPRPVDRCERGIDLERLHDDEPTTCAELLQLWRRLSGPDAYGVANPAALANVVLTARETVQLYRERLCQALGQPGLDIEGALWLVDQRSDILAGVREQLVEAVDGEPGADLHELLARVLRRAGLVQQLITTLEPEQLRGVAAGLRKFCSEGHSPGWIVADALNSVATISEEEQD